MLQNVFANKSWRGKKNVCSMCMSKGTIKRYQKTESYTSLKFNSVRPDGFFSPQIYGYGLHHCFMLLKCDLLCSSTAVCPTIQPGLGNAPIGWHEEEPGRTTLTKLICRMQILYHIEAKTQWPPFCRRHPEIHFLQWKYINCDYNISEVCS